LASGSDDGKIIIWTKRERIKTFGSSEKVMTWAEYKVFFGHTKEVYEVRWFDGESRLISGAHDFSIIVWDVQKARPVFRYVLYHVMATGCFNK
jgi:WD40 repeat protein